MAPARHLLLLCLILCLPIAAEAKIRLGILPVPDTLPLQVAAGEKLFARHGLEVELVPFASALERDTAMQTGNLDGYFGDMVATLLLIKAGVPLSAVLVSYASTPGQPMFGLVTSPSKAKIEATALGRENGRRAVSELDHSSSSCSTACCRPWAWPRTA